MSTITVRRLGATALLIASATGAHAGLLGANVSHCASTVYSGFVTTDTSVCDDTAQPTPGAAVVGAGIEFDISGTRFFDFDDISLNINYVQPVNSASPDLIIFSFDQAITSVALFGPNPLAVTWAYSGNLLGVLISEPLVDGDVTLRINSAIPEPSSALLLGAGLAWLAARRRKG